MIIGHIIKKNIKLIISTTFLGLLVGVSFLLSESDNKLHIYFCDVGQGDAIYIRFPNNKDMLIDGGYGNQVVKCLSENMPFYDREIDVMLLTHPQADHLGGLAGVIKRYRLLYFVSSPAGNNTKGYAELRALLQKEEIEVKNLYSGDEMKFGDISLKVLWPERKWVFDNLKCESDPSCQVIASKEESVLGVTSSASDLNDFSIMTILSYGSFDVLFPGDGDERIQSKVLNINNGLELNNNLEVMKVPHHGSRTGLNKEFLEKYLPQLAIISVGAKNSYGHPSQEIIERLERVGAEVFRTDKQGTIEVISDGEKWWVEN